MSTLVSKADGPELERFARRFLTKYLSAGFQSLSKRDVELLMYYELELSGMVSAQASNHEVAKALRVTARKIALLRRDAWARWAQDNEVSDHLKTTLRGLFEEEALLSLLSQNKRAWKEDGLLPLLLEHPVDRAEVEERLKQKKHIVHHARNREVLLVPHGPLLDVVAGLSGAVDEKRLSAIRSAFAKSSDLKQFLTKDVRTLSWKEARSVLNATMADIVHKATVDGVAKGVAAIYGGLLR